MYLRFRVPCGLRPTLVERLWPKPTLAKFGPSSGNPLGLNLPNSNHVTLCSLFLDPSPCPSFPDLGPFTDVPPNSSRRRPFVLGPLPWTHPFSPTPPTCWSDKKIAFFCSSPAPRCRDQINLALETEHKPPPSCLPWTTTHYLTLGPFGRIHFHPKPFHPDVLFTQLLIRPKTFHPKTVTFVQNIVVEPEGWEQSFCETPVAANPAGAHKMTLAQTRKLGSSWPGPAATIPREDPTSLPRVKKKKRNWSEIQKKNIWAVRGREGVLRKRRGSWRGSRRGRGSGEWWV